MKKQSQFVLYCHDRRVHRDIFIHVQAFVPYLLNNLCKSAKSVSKNAKKYSKALKIVKKLPKTIRNIVKSNQKRTETIILRCCFEKTKPIRHKDCRTGLHLLAELVFVRGLFGDEPCKDAQNDGGYRHENDDRAEQDDGFLEKVGGLDGRELRGLVDHGNRRD
jgi:hypothetical protein